MTIRDRAGFAPSRSPRRPGHHAQPGTSSHTLSSPRLGRTRSSHVPSCFAATPGSPSGPLVLARPPGRSAAVDTRCRVAGPRTRVVHEPYARRRVGGTGTAGLGMEARRRSPPTSRARRGSTRIGSRLVEHRSHRRPPEPDEGVWNFPSENTFVVVIGVVDLVENRCPPSSEGTNACGRTGEPSVGKSRRLWAADLSPHVVHRSRVPRPHPEGLRPQLSTELCTGPVRVGRPQGVYEGVHPQVSGGKP